MVFKNMKIIVSSLSIIALMFFSGVSDPIGSAPDNIPEAIRIASWNVEWFFDDFEADNKGEIAKEQSAPSREEWDWKRKAVAAVIAELEPTILALQEVENRDAVYSLVRELKSSHNLEYKYCFIDGFDFGTEQNVAFIYKNGLVEYSRREQTTEMFDSKKYYNLTKHLIGRFEWGSGDKKQILTLLNLHLRAAPEQEELRIRQGRLAHEWMKTAIEKGENVIILGDFNTEHLCEENDPKSDLGVARGLETAEPNDDLADLNVNLPNENRVTHMLGKEFDHLLASKAIIEDDPVKVDMVFSRMVVRKDLVIRGEPDKDRFNMFYSIPQAERDISDHYPVMAEVIFK